MGINFLVPPNRPKEPSLWEGPILSSNGVIGTTNYAVESNMVKFEAYYALDGNADTGCMTSSQSSGLYWLFYSKTPVKITQMTINQNGNGNNEMNGGNIVASKDNTTWVTVGSFSKANLIQTVTLSTNDYYSYYRLNSTEQYTSGYWNLREVTMSGWTK